MSTEKIVDFVIAAKVVTPDEIEKLFNSLDVMGKIIAPHPDTFEPHLILMVSQPGGSIAQYACKATVS